MKLLYSTNLLILLQNYEQSDTFQKTVNNLILLTEIRKNYRSPSGMFFKSKKGLPQNETHFAAALSNIFYYEVSNKAMLAVATPHGAQASHVRPYEQLASSTNWNPTLFFYFPWQERRTQNCPLLCSLLLANLAALTVFDLSLIHI